MDTLSVRSSSSQATTAYEARYRIDYALAPARAPRVVALDGKAEAIVRRVAEQPWDTAKFYTCESVWSSQGSPDELFTIVVADLGEAEVKLGDLLSDADALIMVATTDSGATAAATLGASAFAVGVMSAGIIVGTVDVSATVAGLRPYARILLVSHDEDDLGAILTAIRA